MFKRLIKERDEKGKIISYELTLNGGPIPENKKYCPVCKEVKTKDLFSSKGNACKLCANARARDHRLKRRTDPEYVKNQNKRLTDKNKKLKEEAVKYMGGKCLDCGGIFPSCVYDFHHLDTTTKEHNPSAVVKKGLEHAKKELDKCVLLCANCHRIRHFDV